MNKRTLRLILEDQEESTAIQKCKILEQLLEHQKFVILSLKAEIKSRDVELLKYVNAKQLLQKYKQENEMLRAKIKVLTEQLAKIKTEKKEVKKNCIYIK